MADRKQNKKNSSFSELALALANDYESIYVIDSSDDSYEEYTAEGAEKELVLKSRGDNFYADTIINCRKLVWPEDQDNFIKTLRKAKVEEALESGKSLGLNYRLFIDGKPRYYFLKAIRKNGKDIIIGVQNVDEQRRRDLKDKEKYRTYSKIAKSLAGMYEAIYYVDINTGVYTEYYTSQSYSELGIDTDGENFFEKVKKDIQIHIYEEDRARLLQVLDRDYILCKLEEDDKFSMIYRQVFDGKMEYMIIFVFKQEKDDDHVVIGVRNIHNQKQQEDYSKIYSHIAGALASRYEVIYYVDINSNNYTEYGASNQYAELGITKTGEDFFKDSYSRIERVIYESDRDKLHRVMEKENLLKILDTEGSMTMTYRQQLGNEIVYVSLMVVRPKNDNDHIIMGVTNIDAQVKREKIIKAESQSFDEVAMALAKRYEVIYLVNIENDDYLEYSANEKYARLELGTSGNDFFEETQKNIKRVIFSEDIPMMSVALTKDNLLRALKDNGKYLINFRLMLDGRPQYVTLFAVSPKEDSKHIIIAVANVDDARKMELEYAEALDSAMDMANHDPLTGMKNKRYYAQLEMKMDNEIAEKNRENFSLIVCDLNGLKLMNDSKGHRAGDAFIQEAATMIRDTFKNSTLFRIGGDEFLVLLEGEDYINRSELTKKFADIQAENLENGLATVAFGMSDFRPKMDNIVQDVFERADKAMYADKEKYKATNRDDASFADSQAVEAYKKAVAEDIKFYTLFEQLVAIMTDKSEIDEAHIKQIEQVLIDISSMFRLSKAETKLYQSIQEESKDKGERLCCYDTGLEGEELLSFRVVTKIGSVAVMTAYMSPYERPLTEIEKERVALVMKTTLNYVSRNRMADMVEKLTFYDFDGYRNTNSFQKYVMDNGVDIKKKAAFKYNLKHFTLVNLEVGKTVGDLVMRRHFEQLEDIIGDKGILCRLGGDNFIGLCAKEQLGAVLTYLMEAPIIYDSSEGKSINISTSVGVYRIPKDIKRIHHGEIMEKVIVAFHAAQNGGKDSIVFYNGDLIKRREGAMKVQTLFPEALRKEEFHVFYQPKVDVRTGELIGAEALCRWFHKDKMISPGDFIPVLEETNDICKLDFYMIDHVCQDIKRWLDQGRKAIRISVNLSRKHLINVNLLDNLMKIIDRHNIPHSCIEVELTETTTDVNFNDLKRVVLGLQSAGIYTSVDDFGVGYSSLNLIKELPWNVIKVDRSFLPVGDREMDMVSKIMFKHVIEMTSEIGMECIVEGVETEQQLNVLRENNCNYAQGFMFDKPLPKEEFEERLTRGFYEM